MLIFALLSSSPSISFHLLPSSSCSSPHHFLHRSFFLFLYITVTVRCGNSRPSALSPFSIFFLKHPSLSLFFFVLTCSPVPLLPFRLPSSFPPRPDLSSNHFFSFSLHLNFSLDHFIFFSLSCSTCHSSLLLSSLHASFDFYFWLLNFLGGQNVQITQDSLAVSLLLSPVSGPPPTFGRRRMESSPHWPKSTVLSCASRRSTNQIMVSTSAKLTTASETARGSTQSWCKVTRKSPKKEGKTERGMCGGEERD